MSKGLGSFAGGADRLEAAATVVRAGEDPEGVHDIRVTCRRLRVGLEISGLHVLRADLRRLGDALGIQRDLDVLVGVPGIPDGLRAWAEEWRAKLRPSTLATVEDVAFRSLVRALRNVPPPTQEASAAALPPFERRVRKAAWRLRNVGHPAARTEHDCVAWAELLHTPAVRRTHALRRRLRKLRYAREWAGLDTHALAEAQDAFGVLSDVSLLVRWAFLWEAEGGEVPLAFKAELRGRVMEGLEEAREGWRTSQVPSMLRH